MSHKKYLHLRLTYHWYDKIESGSKNIDYRKVKKYWTDRLVSKTPIINRRFQEYDEIIFYRAYSGVKMIKKWVKTKELNTGIDTDLGISQPVYAVYFK